MISLTASLRATLDRARSLRHRERLMGHLDTVEGGHVRGWAFVADEPDLRVAVIVLVDGKPVVEARADLLRADLAQAGIGDGRHGFDIELPESLVDGAVHGIDVVDARTGRRLAAQTRRFPLDFRRGHGRLASTLLFDIDFYGRHAGPHADPIQHYRKSGWRLNLDPHPLFSTRHYVALYGPEITTDPLDHFDKIGRWQNASTHPLLELGAPDPLAPGGRHPVFEFLGKQQPAESSAYFSAEQYARRYDGVSPHFQPLVHYLAFGWREGKRLHPDFDPGLFARLAGLDRQAEPFTAFVHDLLWARPLERARKPAVSVIILNYNKALLTLQCLFFLRRHTVLDDVQVIVVDNGSEAADFALLSRHRNGVELVRVGCNRGFGEGNNIGAEHAKGEFLVFLNNDVMVTEGWLPPLLDRAREDESVGAVGAKLLNADGSLQEAGAFISPCGTALQRGKNLNADHPLFNVTEEVDYCSAAALLVRAASFRAVLGFDLCWDPAYYEDADLCLKLRAIGRKTIYAHRSAVFHLEHATSADPSLALRLHDAVAVNRLKFFDRWGRRLADRDFAEAAPEPTPAVPPGPARSVALYTPYALSPGGGERYLLTIAASARNGRCVLFTADRYSRLRLAALGRELCLDLDHVELRTLDDVREREAFDLFVCMGNELLPPVPAMGRVNIFHCQFPFPMLPAQVTRRWTLLDAYQGVIVNSSFTADRLRQAAVAQGVALPEVAVVAPPVPAQSKGAAGADPGQLRIVNVGRFSPDGHCKRQDVLIAQFKRLLEQVSQPLELHLAGVVDTSPAARAFFGGCVEAARGMPVTFHPNATPEELRALYGSATFYWHLTGWGQDFRRHPERFEHFGIALVEAMSAGVIPIALDRGGPSEIVTQGRDGVLVGSAEELVAQTARLLRNPSEMRTLPGNATARAADFSPAAFVGRLEAVVAQLGLAAREAGPAGRIRAEAAS